MDLTRAASFLATQARVLDRRRFELLTGAGSPEAVLAALDGYRNPDGGYGWGLEPDLRDAASQPAGALHAFEVLSELPAPAGGERGRALCDWLASVALADGALPFALPVADPTAVAPFWASADPAEPSLHITAAVTAFALRVPGIEDHRWLQRSIEYCLDSLDALAEKPFALTLSYCLQLLDAVSGPRAAQLRQRLARWIPAHGLLPVEGGADGEKLRPLDITPWPDRPLRTLFPAAVIETELARLDAQQQPDGGWRVDFDSYSEAAALEWRGYATVRAVAVLRANQR